MSSPACMAFHMLSHRYQLAICDVSCGVMIPFCQANLYKERFTTPYRKLKRLRGTMVEQLSKPSEVWNIILVPANGSSVYIMAFDKLQWRFLEASFCKVDHYCHKVRSLLFRGHGIA